VVVFMTNIVGLKSGRAVWCSIVFYLMYVIIYMCLNTSRLVAEYSNCAKRLVCVFKNSRSSSIIPFYPAKHFENYITSCVSL
jgi:hypothetical protein